jgi:hypothetical protein
MRPFRSLFAALVAAALAGCSSVTGQWVNEKGEVAAADDLKTCRSLSGSQAAADTRTRGGLSMFSAGAREDAMLDDMRYGGEERQRQRIYGDCMRKLGYRFTR